MYDTNLRQVKSIHSDNAVYFQHKHMTEIVTFTKNKGLCLAKD